MQRMGTFANCRYFEGWVGLLIKARKTVGRIYYLFDKNEASKCPRAIGKR